MKNIFRIIVAAALVCSCGIYKKYERPDCISAPDNLYGEEYMTADTLSIADLGWRELFTDSLLCELIEKGLERNTDVNVARLHTEQAELSLQTARLNYLPSFNFTPNGGISAFNNYSGIQTGPSWTYTVPVAASWEIDIFGKKTNAKRMSQEAVRMTKEYEQAAKTGLIASIATQYYTLVMLDEQLRIASQTAEKFGSSVRVLKAMTQAGMSNEAAVAQMEGAMHGVLAGIESIRHSITEVENSLCTTLAETPHSVSRGTMESVCFPAELKTGLPLRLLSHRPDVKAAEYNLASAYYAVGQARGALYPSLTLGGTVGWTNNFGSVVNPGGLLLSATASLLEPLFNARVNVVKLKISKSQQQEALLGFQQAILNAGAEVNNALSQYQSALER
ncbi:MAG: TolC family protein, partial [Candidatus Cryptobacteroides sp.]